MKISRRWWKDETSNKDVLYKKKVRFCISSFHASSVSQRTCRETATWIEHIAAAVHHVSHPSLCRNSRPDILIQSGWVLLLYQSIPSGRLGWISHHCRAVKSSHDQNTARGHDWGICDRFHQGCLASRAWQTMNQTMLRIVPITLYIGSMLLLLLLFWEGSTTEPGGTMRWFDPSPISW